VKTQPRMPLVLKEKKVTVEKQRFQSICVETGLLRDGLAVRQVCVEKGCGKKVCVEAVVSKSRVHDFMARPVFFVALFGANFMNIIFFYFQFFNV